MNEHDKRQLVKSALDHIYSDRAFPVGLRLFLFGGITGAALYDWFHRCSHYLQ